MLIKNKDALLECFIHLLYYNNMFKMFFKYIFQFTCLHILLFWTRVFRKIIKYQSFLRCVLINCLCWTYKNVQRNVSINIMNQVINYVLLTILCIFQIQMDSIILYKSWLSRIIRLLTIFKYVKKIFPRKRIVICFVSSNSIFNILNHLHGVICSHQIVKIEMHM